jgi:hypothetical protein
MHYALCTATSTSDPFHLSMRIFSKGSHPVTGDYYCDIDADVKIVKPNRISLMHCALCTAHCALRTTHHAPRTTHHALLLEYALCGTMLEYDDTTHYYVYSIFICLP